MQGVLCAVLAAALGVAALVSRRAGPAQIAFDEIVTIDGLRVPRLVGWSLQRDEDGLLLEEVRGGNSSARKLRIRHHRAALFISPLEFLVRGGEIGESEAKAAGMLTIGQWPGVVVPQARSASGEMRRRLLACAMADGDLIVLRLDGDDKELLLRFAHEVKVADQGEAKMGGEVQLRDGIHAKAERWIHAQEADALRVGRRMVYSDKGIWAAAELTPCVVRPGEEADELVAMMQLRDPAFRAQKMRKVGDRTWVCERADSSIFGGMAALLVKDGQAVLAEFRWDAIRHVDAVAQVQRSLLEQIHFGAEANMRGPIDRGIAAMKALPADLDQSRGFTESGEWEWLDEVSSRTSPLKVPARGKSAIADIPANSIRGGLLPVVLEHLPLEPMVLSSDWMPGMEAVAARPILLRLEPAFDMPRTLPGADEAMRCWSVEVNGSGESSRWYLDEKGKVEVVVFAGKRLLRRRE